MNIILRIPKLLHNELETSLEEYELTAKDPDYLHYFKILSKPKAAEPGDKAYILIDGKIIGYHIIHEIRFVDQIEADQLSHGNWQAGFYIIRKANSWQKIEPAIPYPKTQGQWSWRYLNEKL